MYRSLLIFAAGFVLAAVLFSAAPLTAQDKPAMSAANAAYVKQAAENLEILSSFAVTAGNFISDDSTEIELTNAEKKLTALIKAVDAQEPTIELLAVHTQLIFAAKRCQSFSSIGKSLKKSTGLDALSLFAPYISERAVCASEMHQSRMRLIDYAVPYAVNPFD